MFVMEEEECFAVVDDEPHCFYIDQLYQVAMSPRVYDFYLWTRTAC